MQALQGGLDLQAGMVEADHRVRRRKNSHSDFSVQPKANTGLHPHVRHKSRMGGRPLFKLCHFLRPMVSGAEAQLGCLPLQIRRYQLIMY